MSALNDYNLMKHFIFAFMATVAFGILFQAPKKILVQGGLIGAIGWVTFTILAKGMEYPSYLANFWATVAVQLLCEVSARIFKQPATVFNVPAIIPLVPGLGMYQGMRYIINNDYAYGSNIWMTTGLDACSIALGIMLVGGVFRALRLRKMFLPR